MPTDTNQMKYNKTHHKYLLDLEFLRNTYGLDFVLKYGSSTKATNKMLQISTRIYNYIYNHKQRSKRFWEWYLAFNDDVREVIQETLVQQCIFEYESDASDLQHIIGINFLNGIKISENDLKGSRGIALEAENTLRNYKDGMLLYAGKQIYLPEDSVFDYTEYDY
jgi:hypothetical protein